MGAGEDPFRQSSRLSGGWTATFPCRGMCVNITEALFVASRSAHRSEQSVWPSENGLPGRLSLLRETGALRLGFATCSDLLCFALEPAHSRVPAAPSVAVFDVSEFRKD